MGTTKLTCQRPENGEHVTRQEGARRVRPGAGELSDEEFRSWLTTFCNAARPAMSHAAVAMMFMDWRHISDLTGAALSAGLNLINMVVWDRQRGGMGGLYRSTHEMVAVLCNGATSPAVNNVKLCTHGRDRSNT